MLQTNKAVHGYVTSLGVTLDNATSQLAHDLETSTPGQMSRSVRSSGRH